MTGYEPYLALAVVLLLFAAFLFERFAPDVAAAGAAALFIVFGFVPTNENGGAIVGHGSGGMIRLRAA
ncbi:hypothetical protein OM960_24250 [Defluviimonas sp. CAU 1641]|uniref:SLC13 family permease n=2 Tax=Defluviimonas salinarum TaxID=2992147 RepID=A0ABT3JB12_9RHOB|nr:hypothetical protein [Defluviimonas salinarum]